jgi:hypothetical protein
VQDLPKKLATDAAGLALEAEDGAAAAAFFGGDAWLLIFAASCVVALT